MFTPLNASTSKQGPDRCDGSNKVQSSRKAAEEQNEDSIAFAKYKQALEYLSRNNIENAKQILLSLLDNVIFKRHEDEIHDNGDKKAKQIRQLRYAVFKNLGYIFSSEKDNGQAVHYYLKSLDLNDDDVVVWYDLGLEALKSDQCSLARHAFEQGLRVSPENWLCLDKLIAVYFILGDFPNCLDLIRQALIKNPNHERSLILKDAIFHRRPYLIKGYSPLFETLKTSGTYTSVAYEKMISKLDEITDKLYRDCIPDSQLESYIPKLQLGSSTWSCLLDSLMTLSTELEEAKIGLVHPLSLKHWYERNNEMMQIDSAIITALPAAAIMIQKENTTDSDSLGNGNYDSSNELTSEPSAKSLNKNRKRKSVGSPNLCDISEAKRRSSRLIPGFFMEDPEAFGPLTTRPVNMKDQLFSYLPEDIRAYCPRSRTFEASLKRATRDFNGDYTSDFVSCLNFVNDQWTEVEKFLRDNDNKSFLDIITCLLIKLSDFEAACTVWPESLIDGYLSLFRIWHGRHISDDNDQLVCNIILLALEFDCGSSGGQCVELEDTLIAHLTHYCSQLDTDNDCSIDFCLRFNFFMSQMAEKRKIFDRACFYLTNCLNLFCYKPENYVIRLPNLKHTINRTKIGEKLRFCQRAKGFAAVQTSFDQGDYQFVIDHSRFCPAEIDNLAETFEQKYERLNLLCKSYEKLNSFDFETFKYLVDLLSVQLRLYQNAKFDQITSYFTRFADNLTFLVKCLKKNEDITKTMDNTEFSCRRDTIGLLAETLIELILVFIDFSDNGVRFLSADDKTITDNDIIPVSCWFDAFTLLYDLSKWRELDRMSQDDQYAKVWWTSRKSEGSASGYNLITLVTRSFMILNFAHEELGKRNLCTKDGGAFLARFASELLSVLRMPKISKHMPSGVNDDTLNCAEQCFYCLYNYPRKRSRCLAEHNAQSIPLIWSSSFLLFDFVRPEKSPEFDDSPHTSCISSETVYLLHRIEDLVPNNLKPDNRLPDLDNYIECSSKNFAADPIYMHDTNREPDSGEYPTENELTIVWDLYHLIADYYAKNKDKDLSKICRYYQLDLCISHDRADSWAGLALFKSAIVDKKLSSLDYKYNEDYIDQLIQLGQVALFCFDKAVDLAQNHIVLLVENGSLAYTMHSFLSRAIRRKINLKLQQPRVDSMKTQKCEYLRIAKQRYEKAAKLLETEIDVLGKDAWLVHYMLGKISEKDAQLSAPSQFLPHFHRAAYFLHNEGARYPSRIPYASPKYAYEALEVYYRVYASSLKWILKVKSWPLNELRVISRYFSLFADHPVKSRIRKETGFGSTHSCKDILIYDPDVIDCVTDMLEQVGSNGAPQIIDENSVALRKRIIVEVVEVMKFLRQKTAHPYYKAYYWLARAYSAISGIFGLKGLEDSRAILIGSQRKTNDTTACLFNSKGQFFDGIWVIPADDVSRAGSFAEYLYKLLSLLLKVLDKLGDVEQLLVLCIMLLKKPANQKMQYIKEVDRQELALSYFLTCEQVALRLFAKNTSKESRAMVCLGAYRIYDALRRHKFEKHAIHWLDKVMKECYAIIVGSEAACTQTNMVVKFFSDLSSVVVRGQISGTATNRPVPVVKPPTSQVQIEKSKSLTPSTFSKITTTPSCPVDALKIAQSVQSKNIGKPTVAPPISFKHSVSSILTNKPLNIATPQLNSVKASISSQPQPSNPKVVSNHPFYAKSSNQQRTKANYPVNQKVSGKIPDSKSVVRNPVVSSNLNSTLNSIGPLLEPNVQAAYFARGPVQSLLQSAVGPAEMSFGANFPSTSQSIGAAAALAQFASPDIRKILGPNAAATALKARDMLALQREKYKIWMAASLEQAQAQHQPPKILGVRHPLIYRHISKPGATNNQQNNSSTSSSASSSKINNNFHPRSK